MKLTPEQIETVRARVSRCLDSLGGGSGHLAAYSLRPGTFRITGVADLDGGLQQFDFAAEAAYESEFTAYEEDDGNPEDPFAPGAVESISGYIVLDGGLDLVRDEDGRVRFGPWRVVEPPEG